MLSINLLSVLKMDPTFDKFPLSIESCNSLVMALRMGRLKGGGRVGVCRDGGVEGAECGGGDCDLERDVCRS